MCLAAYYRYVNFHGQREARLSSDQTIYGFQPMRTYLIKTMSILFFYAPELHLSGAHDRRVLFVYADSQIGLESVYTDYVIVYHRWVEFITKVRSEWTEFTLYASIPQLCTAA